MLLVNAVNTEGRPVELFVRDGKIAAVGQDLEALAGENEVVLDAGGLTVLPAFVDLHCHWRTPGFEYKEDIETGSRGSGCGRLHLRQPDAQHQARLLFGCAGRNGGAEGRRGRPVRCEPDRLHHRELRRQDAWTTSRPCPPASEVHHRGRPRCAGQRHHGAGLRHLHPAGHHRDEPRRGYGDQSLGLPAGRGSWRRCATAG